MEPSPIEIPEELIEVILSKCPVKSVVRFKSVSRSWHSIISTPRFSRTLRTKSLENQNKFFVFTRTKSLENQNKFFIFISPNDRDLLLHLFRLDNNVVIRTESMPSYPGLSDCVPCLQLCSCDGLMLLLVKPRGVCLLEHILWNPFLGKYITIPRSELHCNVKYHMYRDSIIDDYKIVTFTAFRYRVYSCENRSWGEIEGYPIDLRPLHRYASSELECIHAVDGCLYVIMRECAIVCFDFRDGKLHEFRWPDEVETLLRVGLKEVSGRLCLYGYSGDGFEMLHLWVVDRKGRFEHSWKKLISMEKGESNMWDPTPVCLTSEDDVVLSAEEVIREKGYGDFVHFMYTRRDGSFKVIYRFSRTHSATYFPYRENLYLSSSNKC